MFCTVHYVHNVMARLGGGWGRNGYQVIKGLAELIVFVLPNYAELCRYSTRSSRKSCCNLGIFVTHVLCVCRILGMHVEKQNLLFKYFSDTLAAIISQAKRTGRYDQVTCCSRQCGGSGSVQILINLPFPDSTQGFDRNCHRKFK